MQLITDRELGFMLICEYEDRHIPKEAGFWWHRKRKRWFTKISDTAAKLIQYADSEVKAKLNGNGNGRSVEKLQAPMAVDADIDFPAPAGLEYMPFQKAGIAYALSKSGALIADEMGLGKTIQAIGVINATLEIKSVLVICPASLRINWLRELEKWLTRPLRAGIATTAQWGFPQTDIVIINYDILGKRPELYARNWDLLICDECHFLKNGTAQRTKAVFGGRKTKSSYQEPIRAKTRLFLTGTPILNRPVELWTIAHALAPNIFDSWKRYINRYCAARQTRWGLDVTGASNLEELNRLLRGNFMIRRLKKDVLTELPAKRRQVVEIPANGMLDVVAAEQAAFARHRKALQELRIANERSTAAPDNAEYVAAVAKLREGVSFAFGEIARQRHLVALAKLPSVVEQAKAVLESVDKLVIFGHHLDVLHALQAQLSEYHPVILTGEHNAEQKQAAVDRFQSAADCRLFIGSIRAAGMGLTLTAASTVLFAELDWTPSTVSQAEDRLHRIGQHDAVLVQHLVVDGSLDAKIAKTLTRKQDVIDRALDRDPGPRNVFDDLLDEDDELMKRQGGCYEN